MSSKTTKSTNHRERILKANSTVFISVAIASVLVVFSAVSLRFLWERKSYNERVITAKTAARDSLQSNLDNLNNLKGQFTELDKSSSTNSKIILHALPPNYDYAALASSLESLSQRANVSFSGSVGADNSANAVANSITSTPIEIPLSINVTGDYDKITSYIQLLETSIRPISIKSVSYSGTNSDLEASIQAVTYYQPARNLDVSRSKIQ